MATSFSAPRLDVNHVQAEINALPQDKQEEIYRDIYGIANEKPKEPEEIQRLLMEVDEILQETPNSRKEHFLRAQELCPEIANDESFRLLFLRADCFDAKDAAKRTLRYWKAKEDVFGRKRAYKRLVLSDLEDNDFSVPRNGGMYVLPLKDRAGRCIYYSVKQDWVYRDRKNFIRWFWYITEAALEDEDVQKRGAIVVANDNGPFSLAQFDRKLEAKVLKIGEHCLPIRAMAIHHCFDSKVHEFVVPFVLFLFGKKLRARYRMYPGLKAHQRMDQFEEMGIPREALPRAVGGLCDFNIMDWIEERKKAGK